MDQTWAFVQGNLVSVVMVILFIIAWFANRELVLTAIKWVGGILTEPDGNGGKASISRVVGATTVVVIIHQSYQMKDAGNRLPPADILWDVFLFSIGYMMLSKALSTVSPAILDFAKGYMNRHVTKPEAPK